MTDQMSEITDQADLIAKAKKAASAIYIATDEAVADDINRIIRGLIEALAQSERDLADARASWVDKELIPAVAREYDRAQRAEQKLTEQAATIGALSAQLQAAQELNPPVEVGSPDGSQAYEIPLTEYLETMNANQIFRATQDGAERDALQWRIDSVLALTGDIGPEARRILSSTTTTERTN